MGDAVKLNNVHETGRAGAQPIVFAHGFGCDQQMWRFVAPAFESRYRVIRFDHIGFGDSDKASWDPRRHGSLRGYTDDLLALLRDLDLYEVVFVGHSVAAMIGVLAAIDEPQRFARLVLLGPSPRYLDDPAAGYVGGFSAADIDDLLTSLERNYLGWSAAMAPIIMGTPERGELGAELTESFCRTDPKVASAFARATFLADNRADLARLRVATLILQCSSDVIAPDSVCRFVHEQIDHSELVRLEAVGHCPNLSAPAETAAAIQAYLDRRALVV